MKKTVMILLLVLLLISTTASAETYMRAIEIQEHEGKMASMGGYVFASELVNGKLSVDGYAIVQNTSENAIVCWNAKFALAEGRKIVDIIDVSLTQPSIVPAGGIVMFVISDFGDVGKLEDPAFALVYEILEGTSEKQYIKVPAQITDYENMEAKKIIVDVSTLPQGRYEAIILAMTPEGNLVFADNKDFDSTVVDEIDATIQDRELRLLLESGLDPMIGAAVIYQK